jgi:hypothetical protein
MYNVRISSPYRARHSLIHLRRRTQTPKPGTHPSGFLPATNRAQTSTRRSRRSGSRPCATRSSTASSPTTSMGSHRTRKSGLESEREPRRRCRPCESGRSIRNLKNWVIKEDAERAPISISLQACVQSARCSEPVVHRYQKSIE